MRPPAPAIGVSPRLQRTLDALETSPALVKNAAWDIVAWNEAAAAALIDHATLAPEQRNVPRSIFCHPRVRATLPDWERSARFVRASFRAGVTRTDTLRRVQSLVDELSRLRPEFTAM